MLISLNLIKHPSIFFYSEKTIEILTDAKCYSTVFIKGNVIELTHHIISYNIIFLHF